MPDHTFYTLLAAGYLALVLYPVFWLLTLPFRLPGIAVDGVFSFLKGIIMLPADYYSVSTGVLKI